MVCMAFENSKFQFTALPSSTLSNLRQSSKDITDLFQKWGVEGRMHSVTFTYSQHFQSYLKDSFALDFFQSPTVCAAIQAVSTGGLIGPLAAQVDSCSVEEVPCTILSMDFFDRLWSPNGGVVRESGHIVKCFDEMCGDFLISDELRKMLLQDESENYDLYSEEERKQFLFKVFKHIALGGPVNQYEDLIKPYLDTAKLLYKELLVVVKDPSTKSLSIASPVYKVQAKAKGKMIFPGSSEHEQTFCYLIIDNIKRQVTAWFHIWY